ncbi:leucyl aminopeptidase [Limimonas halophila]|uniref:Probable cytosol aminopeptidase n=1 Tax=Limimonas halophila TaxID=1082479 RepID=A0A1G7P9J7_9PROT|nr:leucyl aminopeptidase [Limimonas halophila]SDF82884.1 leucyl aminopeptidase [Limimonas halophila]
MQLAFTSRQLPASGALVVGVLADTTLTDAAREADTASGGAVTRALDAAGRFQGKARQFQEILAPTDQLTRIVLMGLGSAGELDEQAWEKLGGELCAKLNALGEATATVMLDSVPGAPVGPGDAAALLAHGARLRSYRFDRYKTRETAADKPTLDRLSLALDDPDHARGRHETLDRVADGVFETRDLVSEPANVLSPEQLAEQCRHLAELGVEVDVLDGKQMKKLGMGALLAVAQGSEREPRLVVMRWNGAGGTETPLAIVGKGVCFDSGGISIKPAGGMEDMKWDMGGAGVTIGAMKALAGRKAAVNVVGVVGLVENMPSGGAYRPGDVLTSMSGQTVEVINTDAEGRLVLADALWYTQETYKPTTIVNLATLTGGIIVALGKVTAGLFSNDDELARQLHAAGERADEPVWRLPLGESYDQDINSDIADMKNTGDGRNASSIAAAQFLQRYIQADVRWAHLDIAGVTWTAKPSAVVPKGGTGFGVRLLDHFVARTFA